EHQHRRQRQLRIARAEHPAAAAGQQILVLITAAPFQHGIQPLLRCPDGALSSEPDLFPYGRTPASRKLALLRVLSALASAEIAYVVRALCNIGAGARQSTGTGENTAFARWFRLTLGLF